MDKSDKIINTTQGKLIGKYAFAFSETISMFFLIVILTDYIINHKVNIDYFNSLLMYQGGILTVTWGAKASSNFTKTSKKRKSK